MSITFCTAKREHSPSALHAGYKLPVWHIMLAGILWH